MTRRSRVQLGVVLVLQTVMAIELVLLLAQGSWINGVWLLTIMVVTSAPAVLGDRLPVRIPAEYELLAILFVFAALFLGEFRSYYERFWWWDIALHTTSGLLLGILGFLIVDAFGALVISAFALWHMKRNRSSFVDIWIDRFIERNPKLFRD
ncbi:MAG: hypothetical protein KJZ83_07365 [Burkholderiaceae bacterium]|nr:hypothetical protein [Burkholderiaceae bacterium]